MIREELESLEKILRETGDFLCTETDNIRDFEIVDGRLILYPEPKDFYTIHEPISEFWDYENENRAQFYLINHRYFKIVGYEHCNTRIYELKLKFVE